MTEHPQALVDRFVQARDAIRAAFRMESDYMYPVCASVFLAADRPVEPEELDRCKRLVKESVGIFSNFRGNIKLPLICMLAAGDDPEDRWEKTQRAYALLKEGSTTIYPMEATPYSSCRVVFVDKFGIRWGIMTEQTER